MLDKTIADLKARGFDDRKIMLMLYLIDYEHYRETGQRVFDIEWVNEPGYYLDREGWDSKEVADE